jgi:signal transduction histidine kinase/ligand-binding sensor domain-containing protein
MPKFPEEAMRASPLPNTLAALIMGLSVVPSAAQEAVRTSELPVEWITVDDGLPQGMVRAILQDRTGYLWFGTKDGLARSDGYGYTVFRHDERDSLSLCADHISALCEDRAGNLWIGTESGAVDRYDPRTGVFAHIVRAVPSAVAMPRAVRQFCEVEGRGMLVLDVQGTVSFAGSGAVREVAQHIEALACGRNNEVWMLGTDQLVIKALEADLSRSPLKALALPATTAPASLLVDTVGDRMVMVRQDQVVLFDRKSRSPTDTIVLHADDGELGASMLDGDKLWLGFRGIAGAWCVALNDGRSVRNGFAEVNGGTLPADVVVNTFAKDRTGNLWIGTTGYGVLLHRALAGRFHRLFQGSSPWLVKADRAGRYVVATTDMLWLNPPDSLVRPIPLKEALAPTGRGPSWSCFKRDDDGNWWACVTLKENKLLRYTEGSAAPVSVPLGTQEEPLMLVDCDSPDLWILASSTVGKPADLLLRFDPRALRITARYALPFALHEVDYRAISAMHFGAGGTLWLGTRQGLLEWRPAVQQWTVHRHDAAEPRSLPSDRIFSLCPDPDRPDSFLWVGTEDAGLARVDVRTYTTTTFDVRTGLPNNTIYGVLADARHQLWVSTNNGLCRFDPRTGATRNYSRNDGLAGTEFNRYSATVGADGNFYFAGTNGVTWFDPTTLYDEMGPSATVITGLGLANTPVAWVKRTGEPDAFLLPSPPDHLTELTLPYAERSLTIHFACMDLGAPWKNRFRYKLEGFHTDWVDAGTTHQASFTNLDPGTYTFRVQGRNSAEVWDEQGATLQLIIEPPWWGTWWFRGAVLLVLGGGLYAFYRYRLAQAMKVVAVRERIARDLHDEIGSTLSSVSLYSSVAQKKVAQKAPEANELLARISESTTQVLESINDIVWAVNADNDDMEHLVKRMIDHAVRMTETRGCALHVDHDPALRALPLDMSARKNLYLVFKEAVNNAVKYSDCTELRVTLVRDRSQIVLSIADNGKGFDTAHVHSATGGGNGLPNMRKRAAELGATLTITSEVGKGTRIELRFVPDGRSKSLDAMTDAPTASE